MCVCVCRVGGPPIREGREPAAVSRSVCWSWMAAVNTFFLK